MTHPKIVLHRVDTPELVAAANGLVPEYADAVAVDREYPGIAAELAAP